MLEAFKAFALENSIVAKHLPKTKLLHQALKGMVGESKKLSEHRGNPFCVPESNPARRREAPLVF